MFGEVAVQNDAVAVNGTTKTTEVDTAESATDKSETPVDAVESLTIEEQGPVGIRFGSDFPSFFSLYGDADSRRLPKSFNDILRRLTHCPKFESLFDESIDDLDRLAAVEHLFRVVLGKLGRNMHGMLPLFEPVSSTVLMSNFSRPVIRESPPFTTLCERTHHQSPSACSRSRPSATTRARPT